MILTNRLTLAKVRCEQPALLGLGFCVPWDTNSEPPFSSPASTYRSACCSCSTLEVRSLSTSQDASQTRSHALRRSSTDRTTCSNDCRHKRRLLGITLVPYTCSPPGCGFGGELCDKITHEETPCGEFWKTNHDLVFVPKPLSTPPMLR